MGRERLMQQQRARMQARRDRRKKEKFGPRTPSSSRIGKLTDPMALRRAAAEKRQEMKAKKQKEVEAKKKKAKAVTPKAVTPKAVTPKAATSKKQMPGGSTRAQVEKSFNKAKGINNFVGPGGSRTRADLKRSESEYNKSKVKKPVRSNFASGRAGAAEYAKAMREYRKAQRATLSKKPKAKTNRRGRRI